MARSREGSVMEPVDCGSALTTSTPKFIAIAAAGIGAVAFVTAIVSTATIMPQLGDSSSSDVSALSAGGAAMAADGNTVVITQWKCLDDGVWRDCNDDDLSSLNMTTASPGAEEEEAVYNDIYFDNETHGYYDCECECNETTY